MFSAKKHLVFSITAKANGSLKLPVKLQISFVSESLSIHKHFHKVNRLAKVKCVNYFLFNDFYYMWPTFGLLAPPNSWVIIVSLCELLKIPSKPTDVTMGCTLVQRDDKLEAIHYNCLLASLVLYLQDKHKEANPNRYRFFNHMRFFLSRL